MQSDMFPPHFQSINQLISDLALAFSRRKKNKRKTSLAHFCAYRVLTEKLKTNKIRLFASILLGNSCANQILMYQYTNFMIFNDEIQTKAYKRSNSPKAPKAGCGRVGRESPH